MICLFSWRSDQQVTVIRKLRWPHGVQETAWRISKCAVKEQCTGTEATFSIIVSNGCIDFGLEYVSEGLVQGRKQFFTKAAFFIQEQRKQAGAHRGQKNVLGRGLRPAHCHRSYLNKPRTGRVHEQTPRSLDDKITPVSSQGHWTGKRTLEMESVM